MIKNSEMLPFDMDENGDVPVPDDFTPDNQKGTYEYEYLLTRQPISLSDGKIAPSLNLVDRAKAISGIMDYFNQESKLGGAQKSGALTDRYGSEAEWVEQGMANKVDRLAQKCLEAVNVLVAREDMLQARFSQAAVRQLSGQIMTELRSEYGPGRANAAKRNKLVKKVKKTACIS